VVPVDCDVAITETCGGFSAVVTSKSAVVRDNMNVGSDRDRVGEWDSKGEDVVCGGATTVDSPNDLGEEMEVDSTAVCWATDARRRDMAANSSSAARDRDASASCAPKTNQETHREKRTCTFY
jgi:hypothetical protein